MIRSILLQLILTFITACSLNAQCELDSISILVSDSIVLDLEINQLTVQVAIEKVNEVVDLNKFLTANNIEIEAVEEVLGMSYIIISNQKQSTFEEILAFVKSKPSINSSQQLGFNLTGEQLSREQIKTKVETQIKMKGDSEMEIINSTNNCEFSELVYIKPKSADEYMLRISESNTWNLTKVRKGWTAYPPTKSIGKDKRLFVYHYEVIYK